MRQCKRIGYAIKRYLLYAELNVAIFNIFLKKKNQKSNVLHFYIVLGKKRKRGINNIEIQYEKYIEYVFTKCYTYTQRYAKKNRKHRHITEIDVYQGQIDIIEIQYLQHIEYVFPNCYTYPYMIC